MIDVVDLIAFAVMAIIIALLVALNIRLSFKLRKFYSENLQLSADKITLLLQLDKLAETRDIKSVEDTQGFIKFLSESRDWAFNYIEDVQTGISEYVLALDNGDPDRIAESLEKLVGMLPENN